MSAIRFLTPVFVFTVIGSTSVSAQAPTLTDFWQDKAEFTNEIRLQFPGDPYNSEYDFYYTAHDSGMDVIQNPNNPNEVFYFMEHWKGGPYRLEPHIYRSTDGGITFTDLGAIFTITQDPTTTCPLEKPTNTTTAHWYLDNKVYCHIQMREPRAIFHQGELWTIWETASIARDNQFLSGPSLIKIPINGPFPLTVEHGNNLRQHPLFRGHYDGDPNQAGDQQTSASTPNIIIDNGKTVITWVGAHPVNSTWERVDTYHGHLSSSPGGPSDCTNLMYCQFVFDTQFITNPFFPIPGGTNWDSHRRELWIKAKENNYFYGIFIGQRQPTPCGTCDADGLSLARTTNLTNPNWEIKTADGGPSVLPYNNAYKAVYASLAKINNVYHLYFIQTRPPYPEGDAMRGISRSYRRTLAWKPGFGPSITPIPPRDPSDLDQDGDIDYIDQLLLKARNATIFDHNILYQNI